MTYSESAKGITITKARALKELERHGCIIDGETLSDFYGMLGNHEMYKASDVLAYLGY